MENAAALLQSASLDSRQMCDASSPVTGTQGYQLKTLPVAAAIISHICRPSRSSRLRGGSLLEKADRGILGYQRGGFRKLFSKVNVRYVWVYSDFGGGESICLVSKKLKDQNPM